MNWQDQLISLYVYICNEYEKHLSCYCLRMSNHADLSFSDEEVLTIYLFGVLDKHRTLKETHNYANRHLRSWFPKLPTYTAFVQRINRIQDVFVPMIESLKSRLTPVQEKQVFQLIDSMPIILAQRGRRFNAKIAPEIATDNGYCATKKLYFYGARLHVLADYQKDNLPIPSHIGLTSAGESDRKIYEQLLPTLDKAHLFADKAYQIANKPLHSERNVQLYTPAKKQKGQAFLDSADRLLSTAISTIRQPIESFFNWLEQKTSIQIASKVRSYNGLIVHVFGRIATALYSLTVKFSS